MGSYLAEVTTEHVSATSPSRQGVVTFTSNYPNMGRVEFVIGGTSGGHLLHLSVAGCVFNDLQREAYRRNIRLHKLTVKADGAFAGEPLRSTGISYSIRIEGEASEDALRSLVTWVDEIGEIPHVIRQGADVKLATAEVRVIIGDNARPAEAQ